MLLSFFLRCYWVICEQQRSNPLKYVKHFISCTFAFGIEFTNDKMEKRPHQIFESFQRGLFNYFHLRAFIFMQKLSYWNYSLKLLHLENVNSTNTMNRTIDKATRDKTHTFEIWKKNTKQETLKCTIAWQSYD